MYKKRNFKNTLISYSLLMCLALGSIVYEASCHPEPEEPIPDVDSLRFLEPKITMAIGKRRSAKIELLPVESSKYHTVTYVASSYGYVEISDTSNDGCVTTALMGGNVIVIERADECTAYLEVYIDPEALRANSHFIYKYLEQIWVLLRVRLNKKDVLFL